MVSNKESARTSAKFSCGMRYIMYSATKTANAKSATRLGIPEKSIAYRARGSWNDEER